MVFTKTHYSFVNPANTSNAYGMDKLDYLSHFISNYMNKTAHFVESKVSVARYRKRLLSRESDIDQKHLEIFIDKIFKFLYLNGPHAIGIFRKSGNVRETRLIITKLENEDLIDYDSISAFTITGVLKHFLKNLPDCLLVSKLYNEWMQFYTKTCYHDKLELIKGLLSKLPSSHHLLLKYLVCVLQQIAKNSDYNQMDAKNLGLCIEPSCLWSPSGESEDMVYKLYHSGEIIAFITRECSDLFGMDLFSLYKDEIENTYDETDLGSNRSELSTLRVENFTLKLIMKIAFFISLIVIFIYFFINL